MLTYTNILYYCDMLNRKRRDGLTLYRRHIDHFKQDLNCTTLFYYDQIEKNQFLQGLNVNDATLFLVPDHGEYLQS